MRRWLYAILTVAAVWLVSSCADNNDLYRPIEETNNVTLHIPSVKGVARTRANDLPDNSDVALAEGRIATLRFLAYPVDGGTPKCVKLAEPTTLTAEYATYSLTLDPGTYRIYLTGNLEPYITETIGSSLEEDDLKAIVLNFDPDTMPNLSDGLPMAAFPEDILEQTGGTITVEPYKGASITADLRFLCSKVRLSLFFDAANEECFSYPGFGARKPVISDYSVNNICTASALYKDKAGDITSDYFSSVSKFRRMVFPGDIVVADDVKRYTTEQLDALQPAADESLTPRMVWTMTSYLPENLSTVTEQSTSLSFTSVLDDGDRKMTYRIPFPLHVQKEEGIEARKLERGTYHDLTACIRDLSSEFELNARVVTEWTLRSLAHYLHGPYRLEVEKTEGVPVTAGEETHLWYSSDVPVFFESEKRVVDGNEINLLIVEPMENHENDSIVITANPALPIDFDISATYFDVIAGNIRKRIEISPFTVKPFFRVTPTYTVVEVREMIESGLNEARWPVHFSTNLDKVKVRLLDGWDTPEMPVEFRTSTPTSSQSEGELIYEGTFAKDGYNVVDMQGFIKGHPYWTDTHNLTLEYTAYREDDTPYGQPVTVEFEIVPKRYNYRIYFRPENDDWVAPHVYIYESLALPFTIDQSKVEGPYKDRAGKPVGGYVFKNKGEFSEAGLKYSFTGKVSFLGWNTQGGPACNNPYQAAEFNPVEVDGFFMLGTEVPTSGSNAGKVGYGLQYIPPENRTKWGESGAMESTIRARYDIDTDYVGPHRSRLKSLCPECLGENTYNMKFPGVRMIMSEQYPGWWYVDLSEVASPGKALIMFHDGHLNSGNKTAPSDQSAGIPLFNFPDNEGWLYYENKNSRFVNDRPADKKQYKEDIYRLCWPKAVLSGVELGLKQNNSDSDQARIISATEPSAQSAYDANFNYVEFRVSRALADRNIGITGKAQSGDVKISVPLNDFVDVSGIRYLTFNGQNVFPGLPSESMDATKFRIYWPRNPNPSTGITNIYGINVWINDFVLNNYDNTSQSIIPGVVYISGSETFGGNTYNYYEFLTFDNPEHSGGWQMHTNLGPYQNVLTFNIGMFTDKKGRGFRSYYRDLNMSGHSGTPPDPIGNKFRIYWPQTKPDDTVTYPYVWIWKTSESGEGAWFSNDGTATIGGINYYYHDFTEATDFPDAGIIFRSVNNWDSGSNATNNDLSHNRNIYDYDPADGINKAIVNRSYNNFE